MQKWQTQCHKKVVDRFSNMDVKLKKTEKENIYKQYKFNVKLTFSLLKSGEKL